DLFEEGPHVRVAHRRCAPAAGPDSRAHVVSYRVDYAVAGQGRTFMRDQIPNRISGGAANLGCSLPYSRRPLQARSPAPPRVLLSFAILLFALVLNAQAPPQLTSQQAQQLMSRSIELMESGGVALPELARAGAPLIENARQALAGIKSTSANLEF